MIPPLEMSGVLPAFVSSIGPADGDGRSPYRAKPEELVERFGSSAERQRLLRGLFEYRRQLRAAGVSHGFQWIDGSFLEDCEAGRGRPPRDIDLVTFAHRPMGARGAAEWSAFVRGNMALFDHAPRMLGLDAYYVDLDVPAIPMVKQVAYWFGLFSHQRLTHLWKGLLQIELDADDAPALASLGGVH